MSGRSESCANGHAVEAVSRHGEAPLQAKECRSGAVLRPRRGSVWWPGKLCRASAARPFSYPIGVIGRAVGTELRPPWLDTQVASLTIMWGIAPLLDWDGTRSGHRGLAVVPTRREHKASPRGCAPGQSQ